MSTQYPKKNISEDLKAIIKEAAALKKQRKRDAHRLAELTADLGELVTNGEATTGNAMRDYFLAAESVPSLSWIKGVLRGIERRMKGKDGQAFLITVRERRQIVSGRVSSLSDEHFGVMEYYFIGLLSGESIAYDIPEERYGIPATRYIEMHHRRSAEVKGNLWLKGRLGVQNLQDFITTSTRGPVRRMELFIGDDEVRSARAPGSSYQEQMLWATDRDQVLRRLGKDMGPVSGDSSQYHQRRHYDLAGGQCGA